MNQYMKKANDLALSNLITNAGGPFGACVVKDGKIIGKGSNNVLKNNDPTAHAEIVAIRNACKYLNTYDLTDCEIYANCYPCPMCLSAIIWSNIKVIYYGNTKEDAAKIGFRDDFIYDFIKGKIKNSNLKFEQIDYKQTIKAFRKFSDKDDKIIY